MSATSVLAGLAEEATQSELLGNVIILLAAMLEKMPRVDNNDRLLVSQAEVGPTVALASGQTLGTADIVNKLLRLGATTSTNATKDLDGTVQHMANAGCNYIYDNIKVS